MVNVDRKCKHMAISFEEPQPPSTPEDPHPSHTHTHTHTPTALRPDHVLQEHKSRNMKGMEVETH